MGRDLPGDWHYRWMLDAWQTSHWLAILKTSYFFRERWNARAEALKMRCSFREALDVALILSSWAFGKVMRYIRSTHKFLLCNFKLQMLLPKGGPSQRHSARNQQKNYPRQRLWCWNVRHKLGSLQRSRVYSSLWWSKLPYWSKSQWKNLPST